MYIKDTITFNAKISAVLQIQQPTSLFKVCLQT